MYGRRFPVYFRASHPLNQVAGARNGKMLSRRSINGCGRALQWFYAIRISPLQWDKKYQCIRVSQSGFHLLAAALNVCLFGYGLNTTSSLVERSVKDSFFGKDDLALNCIWCCCFNTTAFATMTTFNNRNEISRYMNQFIGLHQRF